MNTEPPGTLVTSDPSIIATLRLYEKLRGGSHLSAAPNTPICNGSAAVVSSTSSRIYRTAIGDGGTKYRGIQSSAYSSALYAPVSVNSPHGPYVAGSLSTGQAAIVPVSNVVVENVELRPARKRNVALTVRRKF